MSYLLSSVCLFAPALPARDVAGSRTATEAERKACEAPIDREIDTGNSRMRDGYSNAEGEYLRARLRRPQELRAWVLEPASQVHRMGTIQRLVHHSNTGAEFRRVFSRIDMRLSSRNLAALAAGAALLAAQVSSGGEHNPVARQPPAQPETVSLQVIVKLRAEGRPGGTQKLTSSTDRSAALPCAPAWH